MSGLFHDTFFALVVRAVLGPTYFPHLDEISPPNVYPKAIKRKKSSETTIGLGTRDYDNPLNAPERGFGAFDEQEPHAAQSAIALHSAVTIRETEDHDDPLNARGRGFGAFDEQEARATQSAIALQSSMTLARVSEDHDDPHGFGALEEQEAHATKVVALQSSLTIVAMGEQPKSKSAKEDGSDPMLVTWYGPDDPEVCRDHLSLALRSIIIDSLYKNPMNWSQSKKIWVMFQVCLLTFSVYIGSAIYTAGETDVMKQFHVSSVAATLGLTLFVAGYGLGVF